MGLQEASVRRLEAAEAANARGCMGSHPEAAVLEVAGGIAVFTGAESPLTHAAGIGMNGPVSPAELDRLEAFFRTRGAHPAIELCPFADPGLLPQLGARGYRLTEFNNVLARRMAGFELALTPRVRRARPDEVDLWSHTVGCGFFETEHLTTEEMEVGRAICAMPGAMTFIAATEQGTPAGGAALAIHEGLATLFADSTLTPFRRQGLHRELILARLNEALAQSCDLATASASPGSISQRNYERLGFQVVYTRVTMVAV
jgi:ribosomal protein S18 acetylase RimI-like enzyme